MNARCYGLLEPYFLNGRIEPGLALMKIPLQSNCDGSTIKVGSGCGSVGRAVACNTRCPRFDSSNWQNFIEHLFIISCVEKTKINKKRPGMAHFFLKKTKLLRWRPCCMK